MALESPTPRILLVGVTGYIGGTVLPYLLQSSSPNLNKKPITVLVRGEERAAALAKVYGDRITTVVFAGLEDTAHIAALASQHDIVINAANTTQHGAGAAAMVKGLAAGIASPRGGETNKTSWMIHMSGITNITDHPLRGDSHPERWFDDADGAATYAWEKEQEAVEPYFPRTTELGVIDAAEGTGVNTVVVQAPAVLGEGRGLFGIRPVLAQFGMQFVIEKGYAFYLGDGTSSTSTVHVDDLARFLVLLTEKIVDDNGKGIPTGQEGVLFAQTGVMKTKDVVSLCLDAAFRQGALPKPHGPPEKEIKKVELSEVGAFYGGGDFGNLIANVVWGGHKNTTSSVATKLGWEPEYSLADLKEDAHWDAELKAYLNGKN